MVLFPAGHQKKILNCNANKLRKKNLEIKQMAFSQTKLFTRVKIETRTSQESDILNRRSQFGIHKKIFHNSQPLPLVDS